MEKQVVAVSGGFDPVHPGHLRMFRRARELAGDQGTVLVILNNDHWLLAKKGYCFMNQDERREMLLALRYVDEVVFTGHETEPEDMSVAPELRMYHPDVFLNGGDRTDKTTPEKAICAELGIEMVFNATVGNEYNDHSSELVKRAVEHIKNGKQK